MINRLKKVIKVLLNALMTVILVLGSAFILLYVIGIEPFVVESGSMEPTIQTGSLSFVNKHINYDNIEENDIIAFKVSTGDRVTHRVIKITDQGFETKGDNNEKTDGILTVRSNYIGKNVFSIPKLGYLVKTLQTTIGRIVFLTFIIVILLSGFLMGNDNKGKILKEKN